MDEPVTGRRTQAEPEGSARVEAILDAACRVIAREGVHRLHMKAVADEAGVSKALVHYYFATREELLRRAFAHAEHALEEIVGGELAGLTTGRARLERLLLRRLEAYDAPPDRRGLWNEVWSSAALDPALRPLMRDWYESWLASLVDAAASGVADGSIAAQVVPHEAAWRLGTLVDGVESVLYLGVLDRERAVALARSALDRELAAQPV